MNRDDDKNASSETLTPCSLPDVTLYFLWLGTLGFGGPIALAGYMQRDLVERRRSAVFVLGRRALVDVTTVIIALGTLGVLLRFKKLQEPIIIVASGIVGILLKRVTTPG